MLKHLKTNTKNFLPLLVVLAFFMAPAMVFADPAPLQNAENSVTTTSSSPNQSDPCANTTVSGTNQVDPGKLKNCVSQSPIVHDIQTIVDFLSAGVGIIIIIMIIIGGVQYSLAGGSTEATGKAKTRIINALIALFAYLLIFAFVQWLIPGGIFG